MKKWLGLIALAILLLLTFGCQKDAVIEEQVVEPEPVVEPEIPEEAPLTDYYGELNIALENGDLVEIDRLMDAFMPLIEKEQADDVLNKVIILRKNHLGEIIDSYYSEPYYGIHPVLNEARDQSNIEFASPDGFLGKSKLMVLDLIEDELFRELVSVTFDQGYGLMMAEGSYYPVIDYVSLADRFSKFVSTDMSDYLEILKTEQLRRTLVEEYLAISVEELAKRSIQYETFLKEHPGFIHTDDIRISLMVTLYKFSGPSPFDGLLDESFGFTEELKEAYEMLREAKECPVIQYVVNEMTAFEEEKAGVLGSIEDMNDLFDHAFEVHQKAGQMIDELYINK